MNKAIESRLDVVWRNDLHSRRYTPRAFNSRGGGWGVFDRREDRFLTDAEVMSKSLDELREVYAS